MTAMVLMGLLFSAFYFLSHWLFIGVIFLVFMGAVREWCRIVRFNLIDTIIFVVFFVIFFASGILFLETDPNKSLLLYEGIFLIFWWSCLFVLVVRYPSYGLAILNARVLHYIFGLIPLLSGALYLIYLRLYQSNDGLGLNLVLYALFIVFLSDMGAYATGKLFGKHKFIVAVSPNKTLEGLFGGVVIVALYTVVMYHICSDFAQYNGYYFFIISIITSLFSTLGDLYISMIKRIFEVKDTGNIFPGHGGLLDRLDSVIAAIPIFSFFIVLADFL